ncbi:MAG: hypothetical protein K6F23_16135 [Solobacterium sp.]|nr:hypothetical protein [Solobacterium sp.]
MRKAFSTSICLLSAFAVTMTLGGCRPDPVEEILLGDWIGEIVEQAGIFPSQETVPYYLNIPSGSVWFETVQTAADWQILDPEDPFDPLQPLTREWAAYTLINLSGVEKKAADRKIRDLNASRFPEHVSAAVSFGLMKTDDHSRFRPRDALDRSEADDLLERMITYINTRTFEHHDVQIVFDEDCSLIEEEPAAYDPETSTMLFPAGTQISKGDVISTGDMDHPYVIAEDTEEQEEGTAVSVSDADPEKLIDRIDAMGSFDADFSQAQITDLLDGIQMIPETSFSDPHIRLMSEKQFSRTHVINGFTVSYTVNASGIRAEVTRTSPGGLAVFAEASLSGVHPVYQWNSSRGNVEYGYFRVDCSTNESFSAGRSQFASGQANVKDIDAARFLESLKEAFSKGRDTAALDVPLCTLRIPVPEVPVLNIVCTVSLRLDAEGKAKLNLSQQHSIGMEIRSGKMRAIHHTDSTSKAALYGSSDFLTALSFSLNAAALSLTDAVIEAGINADITSTVHSYDRQGNHTALQTKLPADMVADHASEAEGILVCSDVDAVWILNLVLNSPSTLAGRYGFSRNVSLLKPGQENVFPGRHIHMENFHFVDRCTRTERQKPPAYSQPPESEQIRIKEYVLIGEAGDSRSIEIISLPADCSRSGLRFTSQDSSIAQVNSDGNIHLKQSGSTIITVSSADGKYHVRCTVHVRYEEGNAH